MGTGTAFHGQTLPKSCSEIYAPRLLSRIEPLERFLECLIRSLRLVVVGRRNLDREADDLVTRRFARHAPTFEAQLAPTA